jgi:hypothetical protein
MKEEYRYILDKSSKKHICPECNKRRFVRYIDSQTSKYLPIQYGRCDKGDGHYFLNPYKDGYSTLIQEKEHGYDSGNCEPTTRLKPIHIHKTELVYIPFEVLSQTLHSERYQHNMFLQNLLYRVPYPFMAKDIEKTVSLYYLGTISKGYRTGAITFPFIDIENNIRAIQVKQFDNNNHTINTDFLHSIIEKGLTSLNKPLPSWLKKYKNNEKKVSCLFGEHLLTKYPTNPIALVEAPKTAIYGTLYFGFPEQPKNLIWLAVYNKSSFSFDKLKVLEGRDVYTFPDLSKDGNTFNEWKRKAKEHECSLKGTSFIFSDLLEKFAPEEDRLTGKDIGDFLIEFDWINFRAPNIFKPIEAIVCEKREKCETPKKQLFSTSHFQKSAINNIIKQHEEVWNIKELIDFFSNYVLPKTIKFDSCSIITDVDKFVQSHIDYVENNIGNKTFLPYLERLQKLKLILSDFNIPKPDG